MSLVFFQSKTTRLSTTLIFDYVEHVDFITHDKNHIIHLILMSLGSSLALSLSTSHWSPSNHFPIFTKLSVYGISLPPPTCHSFRHLHFDSRWLFFSLIWNCLVSCNQSPTSVGSPLIAYNATVCSLLWQACFSSYQTARSSKSSPWFSPTLHVPSRATLRHSENLYKLAHSAPDW